MSQNINSTTRHLKFSYISILTNICMCDSSIYICVCVCVFECVTIDLNLFYVFPCFKNVFCFHVSDLYNYYFELTCL